MTIKYISVIVPAHNEEEFIECCLGSLEKQVYLKDNFEVIVVNNNSTDKTLELAQHFDVKIINQKDGPVGAVRNAGAKAAQGEYLAFIDADCIAPPKWLALGIEALSSDDAVYGGGYNLRPSPYWIEKAWILEDKIPPKELLGGCIFIKKIDFFSIGGFDEDITSGEDTNLSLSLKSHGYNVKLTNRLSVVHLGNPTSLKHFLTRQVWHSENYIQNWNNTKNDPTFYLLLTFLFSLTFLFLNVALDNANGAGAALTIIFSVPLMFTIKRLYRSRNIERNLRMFFSIYFLDFLYLLGRSAGLGKSILKWVSPIRKKISQQ
ncbi:glycosyltransferase [Marinobacter adhaerens]|uniref:Glycosyltransferase n=1 Tax=Marinobacter adhaerens TaxID=1033846 RepID=A0A851HLI5_9GAMM|nr:glycosyltransferase [Marinobacter adhaerens]